MPVRNYGIDFLRFFAAFWVVIFHLNVPYHFSELWYKLIKIGHLGVPLFFVISGYCILLTAHSSKNAFQFLLKRLFRIFPAYWFSLIIATLVIYFINTDLTLPFTFKSILATLTLTTDPVSSVPTINWVYWTLSFELFFYLVVFGCLVFPKKWLLNLLFLISIIPLIINPVSSGPLFFLKHWPTFALGMGISVMFNKNETRNYVWITAFMIINILALTKIFLLEHVYGYYTAAIISGFLIIGCNLIKIHNNFFSKLGKYSYAVYLIHVPVGFYLFGLFKVVNFQQHIYFNLAYDIFTYCIISVIAMSIYRFVEKPSIQLGKKYWLNHLQLNFRININEHIICLT